MRIVLQRLISNYAYTEGKLLIPGISETFSTLEPGNHGNKRNISCIPPGIYRATIWHSDRLGKTILLLGVEGRNSILMHTGNFVHETKGCILVGERLSGEIMLLHSRNAMEKIYRLVPNNLEIEVKGVSK